MSVTPNRHGDWTIVLQASTAVLLANNGDTSTAIRLPQGPLGFFLDITAVAADSGDKLDITVQTRLGNSVYVDVLHFGQILGDATPGDATRGFGMITTGTGVTTPFLAGSALASGAVRHLMGDDWRVKTNVTDSGANAAFTFAVYVIPM